MNPLRNEKTRSAPNTIPSEVHFENELNFKWKDPKVPRFLSKLFYYIYVPNITFPTFVDNHILPCPVGTRLKFHGYASDGFANVEFQRTEAGFLYIQNIRRFTSPYFKRDGVVTPDALRTLILRGFKSFPSLIMKYNTITVSIWARCQIFWNPPGIVPEDWKLDEYLQLKSLRHARSWQDNSD
ncbi:uncharacterized protein TNCV_1519841 [Trichonephila clavipes]|nr:uncharacterized protein TNCV_1519841 [Trichonephila clavipes]